MLVILVVKFFFFVNVYGSIVVVVNLVKDFIIFKRKIKKYVLNWVCKLKFEKEKDENIYICISF